MADLTRGAVLPIFVGRRSGFGRRAEATEGSQTNAKGRRSMINTVYRSRWLIQALVTRDLVLRYRGTVIGFFWTLLNPLLFVGIYTLVFSVYLKNPMANFPLFLLSGLIPWQWFSTSISIGTSSIVDGRAYVGKAVFRTPVLIFVPILSNLVNYLLFLPLLAVVAMLSHCRLGWPLLALPLLTFAQFVLTTGLLFISATFNVFFRDLQQLLTTILTVFFYLSPIFFSLQQIPPFLLPFTLANPIAGIIVGYHNIFYYNTWPDFRLLGFSFVVACVIFWVGLMVFRHYEDALPDYL